MAKNAQGQAAVTTAVKCSEQGSKEKPKVLVTTPAVCRWSSHRTVVRCSGDRVGKGYASMLKTALG